MAQAAKRHSTNVEALHPRDSGQDGRKVIAYANLESKVHDLCCMLGVAGTIVGDTIEDAQSKQWADGNGYTYDLSETAVNEMLFSVYHARQLAEDLREAYLAVINLD